MIEIRSILAPTDFSPHAEGALKYACALAERFGATLHLLHVLSDLIPVAPDPMIAPILPPDYFRETEQAAQKSLETLLDPSWGRPAAVECKVAWGTPVEAVIEHARKHAIELIVIATHGRTGLSHVFLGSVAERIVREAPCPVLTIRDHVTG